MQPLIQHFFHQATSTLTYVVSCPITKECVVIDPVLDFDIYSGQIASHSIDQVIEYIDSKALTPLWSLETHAHADHVSAAHYLRERIGCNIACGQEITQIQTRFKDLFNLRSFHDDGRQFDRLLVDHDTLDIGSLTLKVMATPGHTPDSLTFIIGKHAFIGDTLFMPDSGTARCDFPDASAQALYQSIQKIYALGKNTWLYMCHDYQPNQRKLRYRCLVEEQIEENIQIAAHISEQGYIAAREQRDDSLALPRLIHPALQLNINAGKLPTAEQGDKRYIKIPLNSAYSLTNTKRHKSFTVTNSVTTETKHGVVIT